MKVHLNEIKLIQTKGTTIEQKYLFKGQNAQENFDLHFASFRNGQWVKIECWKWVLWFWIDLEWVQVNVWHMKDIQTWDLEE